MFRIIKAGAGIGLTENLNYIKKAENGCYILCPEHDASGIVFEGVAYHLLGRVAMDELEDVYKRQPMKQSFPGCFRRRFLSMAIWTPVKVRWFGADVYKRQPEGSVLGGAKTG